LANCRAARAAVASIEHTKLIRSRPQLRYCARTVFALERLRQIDPEHLVCESIKPGPGGSVSLLLTPLKLIERLAPLIPPPRLAPARGPSLWELPVNDQAERETGPQAQPVPDYEFDQRVA